MQKTPSVEKGANREVQEEESELVVEEGDAEAKVENGASEVGTQRSRICSNKEVLSGEKTMIILDAQVKIFSLMSHFH